MREQAEIQRDEIERSPTLLGTVEGELAVVEVYDKLVRVRFKRGWKLIEFPGELGFAIGVERRPYCIAFGSLSR